ncbi:unnamed protein product [Dovyalis caffra]|uniref:Uncharacterized protein n=1 Tax=Dovyalis caffra TaxID=77055 RepID=A0AAV1QXS4_9ROSI|nr:unnamed protein product [Dovyalis caffra]
MEKAMWWTDRIASHGRDSLVQVPWPVDDEKEEAKIRKTIKRILSSLGLSGHAKP